MYIHAVVASTTWVQRFNVLSDACRAGLRVSAGISELAVDGVLSAMRLPVLTAVLSAELSAGGAQRA